MMYTMYIMTLKLCRMWKYEMPEPLNNSSYQAAVKFPHTHTKKYIFDGCQHNNDDLEIT